MSGVRLAVEQLLSGMSAKEVISEMRRTYTTEESMSKHMSKVRAAIMAGNHYAKEYEQTVAPLRKLAKREPRIRVFLSAPLDVKCKIQRKHRIDREWSGDAEIALQKVQLLPTNLDAFKLPKCESVIIKRRHAAKLKAKNRSVITVPNGDALLGMLSSMLEASTPNDSDAILLCCLAALSGRRPTELLNGRSQFDPVEGRPTFAIFTGQLKTKEEAPRSYVIPLACQYATFRRGFDSLRKKQQDQGGVDGLTNEQVSNKYYFLRSGDISNGAIPAFRSFQIKDLRSLYTQFIFKLYACPHTFNATACEILGHQDLTESLHYANVKVLGLTEGTFGPLP